MVYPLRDAHRSRISRKITHLYGLQKEPEITAQLDAVMAFFHEKMPNLHRQTLEIPHEFVLITYGDQVAGQGQTKLKTLHQFMKEHLKGATDTVHILPFYPYSSDDGFSVINYREVDPKLGDWADVEAMGDDFNLMFDAVINHISAQSQWFKGFVEGTAPYDKFFITRDDTADYSQVVRPRTSPLFHKFATAYGDKHVWTTFSKDQVDLNTANPDVLLKIIALLLFYVRKGARLIRLDAVTFFWKEPGTSCASLPQTHMCVELMRDVLDAVAPEALLVTETNVPHAENISYFGDGYHEAQMVYQFALPPLLVDAVYRGKTNHLTRWAKELELPTDKTAFFNITATHDGIGLRGAQDYLSDDERAALGKGCAERGGKVMCRSVDGREEPYELNITFFDMLLDPDDDPASDVALDRYFAAQSVALSLAGVPGVYFHNLFGTRNYTKGYEKTGEGRTLNRRKFTRTEIDAMLADTGSREARIFARYVALLKIWKSEPSFAPTAAQKILELSESVFAVNRSSDRGRPIVALHNMSDKPAKVAFDTNEMGFKDQTELYNLIDKNAFKVEEQTTTITLAPYQVVWLV